MKINLPFPKVGDTRIVRKIWLWPRYINGKLYFWGQFTVKEKVHNREANYLSASFFKARWTTLYILDDEVELEGNRWTFPDLFWEMMKQGFIHIVPLFILSLAFNSLALGILSLLSAVCGLIGLIVLNCVNVQKSLSKQSYIRRNMADHLRRINELTNDELLILSGAYQITHTKLLSNDLDDIIRIVREKRTKRNREMS